MENEKLFGRYPRKPRKIVWPDKNEIHFCRKPKKIAKTVWSNDEIINMNGQI